MRVRFAVAAFVPLLLALSLPARAMAAPIVSDVGDIGGVKGFSLEIGDTGGVKGLGSLLTFLGDTGGIKGLEAFFANVGDTGGIKGIEAALAAFANEHGSPGCSQLQVVVGDQGAIVDITVSSTCPSVPEPETLGLVSLAVGTLAAARSRRRAGQG